MNTNRPSALRARPHLFLIPDKSPYARFFDILEIFEHAHIVFGSVAIVKALHSLAWKFSTFIRAESPIITFNVFAGLKFEKLDQRRGAGQLFKTTLEKALLSSPAPDLRWTIWPSVKNLRSNRTHTIELYWAEAAERFRPLLLISFRLNQF